MLKKVMGILALSAIATMTWANVDLRTNIQDLFYKGSCEEAGSITMSVNGNDFSEATTAAPIFIRIRLDRNATLCQTLVQGTTNSSLDPIYLGMKLNTSDQVNNQLVADSATVSIVRWVQSEREIWLRVQTASDTWIDSASFGGLIAPSDQVGTVEWTFGVTGNASHNSLINLYNGGVAPMFANLPHNQRGGEVTVVPDADPLVALTTLICVDLTQSTLTAYPDNDSILAFDTISFENTNQGWGTGLVEDDSLQWAYAGDPVDKGNQYPVNFSGDDSIARGWDFCFTGYLDYDKYSDLATADLCISRAAQGNSDFGLVCMENDVLVHVQPCNEASGLYLDSYLGWFADSGVTLSNETTYPWGFAYNASASYPGSSVYAYNPDGMGVDLHFWDTFDTETGLGTANPSTVDFFSFSNNHGYYLANTVFIHWQPTMLQEGYYLPAAGRDIFLHAKVCQYYSDGANPVTLAVEGYLTEDDSVAEENRCPIEPQKIFDDVWEFGQFVPCTGDPVTIFFPYVPMIQGSSYWAGVALVNQGIHDFEAGGLTASIYEATGTHYVATLDPLAVKNMQTWLFTEGDEGVGFYNMEASGTPFIQPTLADGETDLAFGDERMSMFVTGTHAAVYVQDQGGADLDGYLLIGDKASGSVDGAYLPRNIVFQGQIQDMPVAIRKK